VTTVRAILATTLPWIALAALTWGLAGWFSPYVAAVAFGGYLLADGWYSDAIELAEKFAPYRPQPDRKPE